MISYYDFEISSLEYFWGLGGSEHAFRYVWWIKGLRGSNQDQLLVRAVPYPYSISLTQCS